MLSKKMESAIEEQINAEFWSSYLYLSMSLFFANEGLSGVSNWFNIQYKEEQEHAEKLINYVISRGNSVKLAPIQEVDNSWESVEHAFTRTLAHEKEVTRRINNLMSIAQEEKDYSAEIMLQWFIQEQVEEEDNVRTILDKIKLIDGSGNGLYLLDQELASRVHAPIAK